MILWTVSTVISLRGAHWSTIVYLMGSQTFLSKLKNRPISSVSSSSKLKNIKMASPQSIRKGECVRVNEMLGLGIPQVGNLWLIWYENSFFPDWSLEMHILAVLIEVLDWPILLLAIVGMYNGMFIITNEFKLIFYLRFFLIDYFIKLIWLSHHHNLI